MKIANFLAISILGLSSAFAAEQPFQERSVEASPLDQSNDPADLKITKDIRQALVADNELTSTAKNIQVITTAGGKVTLKGSTNSAEERTKIVRLAEGVAGAGKVDNQLEVKSK